MKPQPGTRRNNLFLCLLLMGVVGWLAWPKPTPPPPPDLAVYPWICCQMNGPSLGETAVSTAEVMLVGDVLFGRDGLADPLAAVRPWLATADLTIGNLEGVLTPFQAGAINLVSLYTLWMPINNAVPSAIAQLRRAGFDLLSLANNHSLDAGGNGLAETAVRLQNAGITPLGLTGQPTLREVNGVRLAFLACNAVPLPTPFPSATAPATCDPRQLTAVPADVAGVIVWLHWGYEYELRPDPAQERLAAAFVAAGADLVVGSHPHVAQPVVLYGATPPTAVIAYSLGNFLFPQGTGDTGQGLALRAIFAADGLRQVQLLPLWVGPQPRLMSAPEAQPLLARVQPPPPQMVIVGTAEEWQLQPAGAAAIPDLVGQFTAGQIDLTGDGIAETVRREGEQVTVYAAGTAVWQTPPTWRVVDLSLGDPNNDGRGELLLALYQRDAAGYERSQPYIVGYRGGAYGLMWGGRPVLDPIQEVELGDIDGDGIQELLVIENWREEGQTISIWRWAGWTFTLLWRSQIGRYANLVLVGERPYTILVSTPP